MARTRNAAIVLAEAILCCAFAAAVFPGCGGKAAPAAPVHPPAVTVAEVMEKTVPVRLNYIGITQAVKTVDVRARVEGFLQTRNFAEGADVRKGDTLFVIDQRPFQAELDRAQAQLARDQATLDYARLQAERYRDLTEKDFVAKDQYDNASAQAAEAAAAVKADNAAIQTAGLNLGYCTVAAPIDGRIGRTYEHEGSLVAGQSTKLATVVQMDPLYVYFSPSAEDLRRIQATHGDGSLEVGVRLSDGTPFPHGGKVDFLDNTVDSTTGTVAMRAVVPNPEKTLLPGVYLNVDLRLGEAPNTLMVPQQAVAEDQGGAYVFVVSVDGKVERRQVEIGQTLEGAQVVRQGLRAGEKVVTEGLQFVRPGMAVQAQEAANDGEPGTAPHTQKPAQAS